MPLIVQEGREWYRSVGTEDFPGTKVISLGGAVRRPGTYEVPFGTTIRTIVEDLGGGAREGRELQAVLCGGPSGGLIPVAGLDIPIVGGPLADTQAMLGAGGMVVIDDSLPIIEAVEHLSAYNARESCGKCTPCREGMAHMARLIGAVRRGTADATELAQLDALPEVITAASLCGLGQAAPMPYLSLRRSFPGGAAPALSGVDSIWSLARQYPLLVIRVPVGSQDYRPRGRSGPAGDLCVASGARREESDEDNGPQNPPAVGLAADRDGCRDRGPERRLWRGLRRVHPAGVPPGASGSGSVPS